MTIIERTDVSLIGNPHRVLCRLFIPGEEELIRGTSRAKELVQRCMRLSDEEVDATLAQTIERFGGRHRGLVEQFQMHASAVDSLLPESVEVSDARRKLIGAYLTQEYAFESTAYFNPSIVPHPDQSGLPDGHLRFIMSIRAVGEGHLSTLVFRTGTIGPDASVRVDDASPWATTRATRYTILRSRLVAQAAVEANVDTADLEFVLGMLPDKFTPEELTASLNQLRLVTEHSRQPEHIGELLQELVHRSYELDFPEDTDLTERVFWPTAPDERRGIEDARFVRFLCDDGVTWTYRATYTAFDGMGVVSRVLETDDFTNFSSMGLSGKAVANKGVAFFPRLIHGRHAALSRWDRESNSIAYSDDGYHWNEATVFHASSEPWELIHVGNCGSPIETDEGWLVLTHGAGPMRAYGIGAVLLDRDDPEKVIATYPGPLLEPSEEERNGYVPNVVYSCGSLIHNGNLVLPYGFSDVGTRVAVADVRALMSRMDEAPHRNPR